MSTVDQYYQTLYTAATPAQARALVTSPSDEEAHADLLRICGACTAAEIAAVLERLQANELDGYYIGTCFAGIVAVERGLHPLFDWGARLPAVSGAYHDWEWCLISPEGLPKYRALLEQWLGEALAAAMRREGI